MKLKTIKTPVTMMPNWISVICWMATLFCLTLQQDDDWNYDEGTADWGQTFPMCNGNTQSPIRLFHRSAVSIRSNTNRFNFQLLDYDQLADANFTNTGHTVNLEFNYNSTARPRVSLTTNGSTSTYLFTSLHFHWPAEHEIDFRRFPLELHLVHINPENNRNLVLGYLFHVCKGSPSGMDVIATAVRRLREPGSFVELNRFAPYRVMPRSTPRPCNFFNYNGSLTTPPCTQGVTWFVSDNVLCIKRWQLMNFLEVRNGDGELMEGNLRPPQPLNNRTVRYTTCPYSN